MKDKQVIAANCFHDNVPARVINQNERGFALVAALIILIILGVISVTVLTFASSETRLAESDLKRSETFYAAASKSEDMAYQINNLFQSTTTPTAAALNNIANNTSPGMDALFAAQGYSFQGSVLEVDAEETAALTRIFGAGRPFLRINSGAYFGMSASVVPYKAIAVARNLNNGSKVTIERKFNSYLIPIFQFSIFSDGDVELDPGVSMTVSGRVHANGNIYALRNLLFTGNITTAGELVRDVNRSGDDNTKLGNRNVEMVISSPTSSCPARICRVPMNFGAAGAFIGSVDDGPYYNSSPPPIPTPIPGSPAGYWPGSPTGSKSVAPASGGDFAWDTESLDPPTYNHHPGHFNKQLLTKSNFDIKRLTLPLGVDDVTPVELIKRRLPVVDGNPLYSSIAEARYANKAKVRILIDDEPPPILPPYNEAGIQSGAVFLSDFKPIPLCVNTVAQCNPLRRVYDSGVYADGAYPGRIPIQLDASGVPESIAATVRGVRRYTEPDPVTGRSIPGGAGLNGRIKIEIAQPCTAPCTPTYVDVTSIILSMGMTVGEPNAIVRLQRPLWAAFMQDSRDRTNASNPATLYNMQKENGVNNGWESDGEIKLLKRDDFDTLVPGSGLGFIKTALTGGSDPLNEDPANPNNQPIRKYAPPAVPNNTELDKLNDSSPGADFNAIVPINFYNVREGWINDSQNPFLVSKRGVTSVIDLNMYNLRRWLDGVYDTNLLGGADGALARSTNIGSDRGYVIYISDRRGDSIKSEILSSKLGGGAVNTTNGDVDNEDVYFDPTTAIPAPIGMPGSVPNSGEDVIVDSVFINKTDLLQKDSNELPDSLITNKAEWDLPSLPNTFDERLERAVKVMSWHNDFSAQQLAGYSPEKYFRRSVRLSFGEKLATVCNSTGTNPIIWNCGTDKLSPTKGITVASENMVYLAGNYNTTGIGSWVAGASNLNSGSPNDYLGVQVPASIVCDAFFPLSKTWFDANSAMYPEGNDGGNASFGSNLYYRIADNDVTPANETAVRAAVMFGNTISALRTGGGGSPARNSTGLISSGGMHNAPRFLEHWNFNGNNYTWSFSGSLVTLFNSTQAFAPWENKFAVTYLPPRRNWGYDNTFSNPDRLPPGTPLFQYIQSSGFEQTIKKE